MNSTPTTPVPWDSLSEQEQLALRESYGHYLDRLPPTCSLDAKIARFAHWLKRQGIDYNG